MKSYGILQKEIGNEYLLIYKTETSGKTLLSQITKPLQLSFYVICEDAFLLNYSDFSLDDMNQGFRFVNDYTKENQVRSLHKNDVLSEEEKIVLVKSYNTLSHYCKSEEDAVVLSGSNGAGANDKEEIFKGTFKELTNSIPFSDLLEIGNFTVSIGDSSNTINCYAVEPSAAKIFGVMELKIDKEMLNSESTSYEVTIGSRKVVWRYHIVNREQVMCKDFKVYSGKTLLPVKKESLTVLGTGENAYLLETSDPIEIAERYENLYELEFVKEDLKTGQILSKKRLGLPVPEISKIKISKSGEGYMAYSDMYIYL